MSQTELFCLAFPKLERAQEARLTRWCSRYDPERSARVAPHFTIGFGGAGIGEDLFFEHVKQIAGSTRTIDFTCRRAVVGTDHQSHQGFVFLIPDEGNGALYALHERMYGGILEPHRRLDIPFKPHITVANTKDLQRACAITEEINAEGFTLLGEVSALSVVAVYRDGSVKVRETVSLG